MPLWSGMQKCACSNFEGLKKIITCRNVPNNDSFAKSASGVCSSLTAVTDDRCHRIQESQHSLKNMPAKASPALFNYWNVNQVYHKKACAALPMRRKRADDNGPASITTTCYSQDLETAWYQAYEICVFVCVCVLVLPSLAHLSFYPTH